MVGRATVDWFEGAAAQAVERTIRRNELHGTREGRYDLIRWLIAITLDLEVHGLPVDDLHRLILDLTSR